MAESEKHSQTSGTPENRLISAIERARSAQANRDDVVVEMKQTARARLELLAHDLQPVFAQIPDENDQFEFALTDGEVPRLWIDMTSYVRMDRERRRYEFVKDTRNGRLLLGESADRNDIAVRVTDYVAERILERERMLEGEWHSMWVPARTEIPARKKGGTGIGPFMATLLFGFMAGAAAMVAWAWFGQPPG
jgi:hypothetical protein